MSVGPPYQGIASLRRVTLSPFSAQAGMQRTRANPTSSAKARYSLLIRSNSLSFQPTASILLTTTTTS
jgi:hypothetical protein